MEYAIGFVCGALSSLAMALSVLMYQSARRVLQARQFNIVLQRIKLMQLIKEEAEEMLEVPVKWEV
jgi:hypothetical protein